MSLRNDPIRRIRAEDARRELALMKVVPWAHTLHFQQWFALTAADGTLIYSARHPFTGELLEFSATGQLYTWGEDGGWEPSGETHDQARLRTLPSLEEWLCLGGYDENREPPRPLEQTDDGTEPSDWLPKPA